ncbi:MAG: UDP-N-acetylmuramate--L-alanine ligase [bacterium]
MNLKKVKKAYFVGIKGVGMTALVQVFQSMGIEVMGSDVSEKFFTDNVLARLNILVVEKFDANNILLDIDIVVSSAAYYNPNNEELNNLEVKSALQKNIPVLTYAQALGLVFKEKYGIAVAGTHGKSTTTAMLGIILEATGFDPTVVVGSQVAQWQSNARVGQSRYLIVEADEYRDNFLNYWPQVLILNNIEYDHPDYFKSMDDYKKSFKEIIERIPRDGFIVANKNDDVVINLIKYAKCEIVEFSYPSKKINLKLPGRHNQLNAMAAMATALRLGAKKDNIYSALESFCGISRRFEFKKEDKGVIFIDDYAHHPSEIKAALQAAKEMYSQNTIWAIFQPHTFSRTEKLLDDFGKSFESADKVIILDIYGSAREKSGNVHATDLINKINNDKAVYIPTLNETADFLVKNCHQGDVVLMMGAGDVWKIADLF